ncbi:Programmed cell death 6-interacting protein [Halotydeus destructor]|nr:Programmed cell death 6-interacting protein [Halotydeus destructor]
MASFVAVPLKRSSEVDMVKPLKNLIASYYSTSDEPVNYDEAIEAFNKMRSTATSKHVDVKHEGTVEQLEKYYDQITSLEVKCPPSEISISFKWKDALDKGGSFLLGSSSLAIPSIGYEKICVLFNIAAAQSQVGAGMLNESLTNDQALKAAAKHFSAASGIFQTLKHMGATVGSSQELTADLHPDILHVLHLIMLAQAQEAFFWKAANDNMKDAIIAKIAAQCNELYLDALKNMHLKYAWPDKEWMGIISMKQVAFHGISEYYQSLVSGQSKIFGEQIARLAKAVEMLRQAESKASYVPSSIRDYETKANRAYEDAKKDNDFIYHAKIPDYKALSPIGKAALAKPTPMPEKFRPDAPDLFEKLLPVSVQQAVGKLDLRKQEVVNTEVATLREATQVLNATLASLNLPAAIEDITGVQLPPSLREKAEAIKAKGGAQRIEKLISDLPDLLTRNKEILDEIDRSLKAEEDSDNSLRQQFGARWTRTPSNKLNTYWKDHVTKYRSIIQNAIAADEKVKQKYGSHSQKIKLLSEGTDRQIIDALPSGGQGGNSLRDADSTRQLHRLMDEVEAMKTEREVIESELKNATFSEMKTKFLSALQKDGAINETALSAESLGEVYGPLQKQIRDSKARQDQLLSEVQRYNEDFVRMKSQMSGSSVQRDAFMSDLASAHDAYMELLNNLEEGTKFYNDLTQLLVNLQNKVEDFCFARRAEREELCKDMQQAIVSSSSTTQAPPTPAYHSNAPPRPPPPTVVPASVAPPTSQSQTHQQPPYGQPNVPFAPQYAPNPNQPYYYPPPPLPSGFNPYAPTNYPPTTQWGGQQPQQHQQQYQQPGNPAYPSYPYPYPSYPNAPQ